jgi:hypothetical protein
MRTLSLAAFVATIFVLAGALATAPLLAQQPGPAPQQGQAPPPPKPYKPVTIKLPQPIADQTFVAFRKQIADVAQKKDRAALARLVSMNFFLIAGEKDAADKKKPGIDNLAKALSLDNKDGQGWQVLAEYAMEPTAETDPDHKGVLCAPAGPEFDEKLAEALAKDTQTDPGDWGYPIKDGIQVRAGAGPNTQVIDKLGLYLVRVYPDDSPAGAVAGGDTLRIVLPSGKLGYVGADQLLPIGSDQMCYIKEGNAWKITGFIPFQ